ncbi:MAG: SMP-30/gluconolactonase/LRE family protein [Bryobacteraceae bacterium]
MLSAVVMLAVINTGCTRSNVDEKMVDLQTTGVGSIVRLDPAFDSLVPTSAKIEKLLGGQEFTEGPMYMREGFLLFSDIPRNAIYKWTADGTVTEFRKQSGYSGTDAPKGAFIGSNGLTLDKQGRLTICEHGNRRVTRLESNDAVTVMADKFEGKRLNSPNDAVYKSDGSLYFTDPPYGFPKEDDDPKKELKFNGVYRLQDGKLQLLTKELTRPNGLAFSPDEKYLYVANSDAKRKIWMRYEVEADGKIKNGKVFYDVTSQTADGLPDGMKVDTYGNLYATGPGGIWVISPEGKHLGTIKPPETPANLHWGKSPSTVDQAPMGSGEYATALYITARTGVYRISLSAVGIRP